MYASLVSTYSGNNTTSSIFLWIFFAVLVFGVLFGGAVCERIFVMALREDIPFC